MPWFEVTADRFDWMPTPRRMVSYTPDQPWFGTDRCVAAGIARGAVRKIAKPKGWSVGKDGKVRRDD